VFVAKYARDGALLWARSAGSPGHGDWGFGIATDLRGNSYVTGRCDGPATFGAGEANETVLESVGFRDAFVAKYAPDGRLLWATSAGGLGETRGTRLATDLRGNSYVTGDFESMATFGAGEANETVLEARGNSDAFVAKYGDRNDQDQCLDSDASATVVIDGNDTGVENALTDTGCTILDLIRQASDDAADHAEFIRGVALLTRTLLRDGLITAEEAGILRTAASQAMLPLS
jgi:Beta-propeller repeat